MDVRYCPCAQWFLQALQHCHSLTSIRMNASDTVMGMEELSSAIKNIKHLTVLHLDLSMRNDLHACSLHHLFMVGMGCLQGRMCRVPLFSAYTKLWLNMKMCDLADDVLYELCPGVRHIPCDTSACVV